MGTISNGARAVGLLAGLWGFAGAAAVPEPVKEFIADASGYVVLMADDPSADDASFARAGRWSDGAAPSGEKDYLVQGNRVLRAGGPGATFAGRSLTLDNGRIKAGIDNNTTMTFPDLRIYGGRLESATPGSKVVAGALSVLGTEEVPSRISGCSGRAFRLDAQLKGEAGSVLKVMATEGDAMTADALFCCTLNNTDNEKTYRGRFVVEGRAGVAGGRSVALAASYMRALGAGDPDAATAALELRNGAIFIGSSDLKFTDPRYSIALDGSGTLQGDGMNVYTPGVTFGGGVRIAGKAPGATLYVRGDTPVAFEAVQLENVARMVVERGTALFGEGYEAGGLPVAVEAGAEVGGASAALGALTLREHARFSPGSIGAVGTLAAASAVVEGCVTGVCDVAYADGALTADRLVLKEGLRKGGGDGRIVFAVANFPTAADWAGSVRLLSSPDLGEADGFGVDDFEMAGLPKDWAAVHGAGALSIVADGETKHLVWTVEESPVPVVRILPLGDSITYGAQSACAGYREPLYQRLAEAGYRPDFVGTLKTSAGAPVTDPDHEGHSGWVIAGGENGLLEHVEAWLGQIETPHVILLHIGANDVAGDDFAHAKDRLAQLVDRLGELCPGAWVVVTTLLPRTDREAYAAAVEEQFNPYVAEIVRSRRVLGRRVAFLDLHAAVTAEQLSEDGVHPNDEGYAALAEAWFGALAAIMPTPRALPSATPNEKVLLTGENLGGTSSWNTRQQWSNGQKPTAGKFYYVPENALLRTPDVPLTPADAFAGEALVFDGGRAVLKHGGCAAANWVLFGGSRLAHGMALGPATACVIEMGGTLDVRGTAAAPALFTGSSYVGSRALVVSAALYGTEDAVVRMARTPGETDTAGCGFTCTFTGDNAAYRGRFAATSEGGEAACWALRFGSAAALGAPVAEGAKVTLGAGMTLGGAGLALTNGYALALEGDGALEATGGASVSGRRPDEGMYVGRGGRIAGTGASALRLRGAAPFAFDDAALDGVAKVVVEAGATLRVYPGYRQPEVPVETSGTILDETDGLGPVTVKAGGSLQPGFRVNDGPVGTLGMAALAVEDGGRLVLSVVVENGQVRHDAVRVAGDLAKPANGPIPVVFDRYPANTPAGTRVPLLTAANLGRAVTADDFAASCVDASLDAVVRGRFEVETADGTPTLVFVQTSAPMVDLRGQDMNGADSWASGRNWSDGAAPRAGYGYRIPSGALLRRSTYGDGETFAGDFLAVIAGGDFAINGLTARVNDLRLFSDGVLTARNDGDGNRLCGTATVYAASNAPFSFEIEKGTTEKPARTLTVEAALKGAGDLRFRYYRAAAEWNAMRAEPNTFYVVTGDNAAFTGGVELFQQAVCADFRDERAMGGPAAAFRADRLRFTSNATLRCSASYAMGDPTRGVTFGDGDAAKGTDGGTIRVEAGQTLVVSNVISGTTSLRKTGTGTLALCCPSNAFSGVVRNLGAGGVLAVGAAGAVAHAALQSPSGAVWRVDAPEGMTVRGLDAVLEGADGNAALDVRPGAFAAAAPAGGRIVANLVRFRGATKADAEAALARVRLDASGLGRGWRCGLAAEETPDGLLVVATARRVGLVIGIR